MTINLSVLGSNQQIVTTGDREYFFSYSTCVAYREPGKRIRRDQTYSVTTAKHMNQMGVKDWPQVSDAEFEAAAS